jgi:hypothetical protein
MVKFGKSKQISDYQDEDDNDSDETTMNSHGKFKLTDEELFAKLDAMHPFPFNKTTDDDHQLIRDIFQSKSNVSPSILYASINYVESQNDQPCYYLACVSCNVDHQCYMYASYDNYYIKKFHTKQDAEYWLKAFGLVYWDDMCRPHQNDPFVFAIPASKQKYIPSSKIKII